jgi:hypothetical protein
VIIPVDIPGPIFFKLAGAAEKQTLKVADLLRQAAHDLAEGERDGAIAWRADQERAIRVLYEARWSDDQIGKALGFSRGTIGNRRRLLGIVRSVSGRPSCVVLEQTKKEN